DEGHVVDERRARAVRVAGPGHRLARVELDVVGRGLVERLPLLDHVAGGDGAEADRAVARGERARADQRGAGDDGDRGDGHAARSGDADNGAFSSFLPISGAVLEQPRPYARIRDPSVVAATRGVSRRSHAPGERAHWTSTGW